MSVNRVLFISAYWPESNATAAGIRLNQLIQVFKDEAFELHYASTAEELHSARILLDQEGIKTHSIALNEDSFNEFVEALNPTHVVFDRYIVEEQFGWRVRESCPNALRILDTEDLHSLRVSRQLAQKESKEWSVDYWKAQDIAKREMASIYRSDLSILISKVEMALLLEEFQIPESLLVYLPFLPRALKSIPLEYQERLDFIFIGNGMHAPNRDAVIFLKEAIWPLIVREIPKAKLHIYGAYLPQQILEFHQPKQGFIIHGKADHAYEVLGSARVNLAPLRYGAGIKGKVIEGILCGTPTVCTDIAAEGITGIDFVAKEAQAIAERAILWYQEESQWNAEAARYKALSKELCQSEPHIKEFIEKIQSINTNLVTHRNTHFIGEILQYHLLDRSKYFSKWIQEKNKNT